MSATSTPEWSNTSSQYLRDFLAKCPEFRLKLVASAPRSGTVDTLEAAATAGQRVEGYMMAVDRITELAQAKDAPAAPINFNANAGMPQTRV